MGPKSKETFFLFGLLATPCASPPLQPTIFLIILFLSTTLLIGMAGISLHMQWPLTSQLHGSFLKESTLFFVTDQTPRPGNLMFIFCTYWFSSHQIVPFIDWNDLPAEPSPPSPAPPPIEKNV
jgi:hypothetical protein